MQLDYTLNVLIGIYLIALHALLAVALIKTDLIRRVAIKIGLTKQDFSEKASLIPQVRELHRRIDRTVPKGATIFLGDGITAALATAAVVPYGVNYGIGSQRSDQLIRSMDIYESIKHAERVVVMIGTNDILQGREAGIESRYQAILAKIPPNIEVFLSSVPPLGITEFAGRQIENSKVRFAVMSAESACKADHRCRFVNAYNELSIAETPLPGVLSEDGRHLTPRGYELWIKLIREAITLAAAGK